MPKKYFRPLQMAVSAMILATAVGVAFAFLPFLQFIMIALNAIIWLGGIAFSAMVMPKNRDETGTERFVMDVFKKSLMVSFQFIAINFAISFGISFVGGGLLGGALFKHASVNISYFVLALVNYAVYAIVMVKIIARTGYAATEEKRYNEPLYIISLINAFTFILGTSIFDSFIKPPLGTDMLIFANAHTFLTGLLDELLPIPKYILNPVGTIIVCLGSMVVAFNLYKYGRKRFFEDHPHNMDYDAELQAKIYEDD